MLIIWGFVSLWVIFWVLVQWLTLLHHSKRVPGLNPSRVLSVWSLHVFFACTVLKLLFLFLFWVFKNKSVNLAILLFIGKLKWLSNYDIVSLLNEVLNL